MRKKVLLFFACLGFLLNNLIVLPKADSTNIPLETELFGQSALLMDADSGRVLWEKNGEVPLPMASTTKIMTCLVTLEHNDLQEVVTVSQNAAAQPDVQMNIATGETYILEELLYGMMLESYNDVAVAVAEHVGGTVEAFATLMNEKALEIGCKDTHFVTPNGLDGEDAGGIHHTTAEDLAKILACAIQNPQFVTITSAQEHNITECSGKRTASATNKNALLRTTEGAISGKTGFTGKAGFCYAGAVSRDGVTLVAVTLGCGWPPHKTYKWQDMNKLFTYGFQAFRYKTFQLDKNKYSHTIKVHNGQQEYFNDVAQASVTFSTDSFTLLVSDADQVQVAVEMEDSVNAPVKKGEQVGQIIYTLNGELYKSDPVLVNQTIKKIDFLWCLESVLSRFTD